MNSYSDVIGSFTEGYIREYGERKLRKISSKINESNGVMKYLVKLQEVNTSPLCDDIIATVMNMPYFMVAKKETVAIASIILLEMWNDKINLDNKLLSDSGLETLARRILRSCGEML
jgi:hypothetical protein